MSTHRKLITYVGDGISSMSFKGKGTLQGERKSINQRMRVSSMVSMINVVISNQKGQDLKLYVDTYNSENLHRRKPINFGTMT